MGGNATISLCEYCFFIVYVLQTDFSLSDEHYKRAPNCPFFTRSSQSTTKKGGRSKASRTSKASRLSTQSVMTTASEAPSIADTTMGTATADDSIMTTASTMTQGGSKKPRAKKATTAKGKKTKAKKAEPAESVEEPAPEPDVVPEPEPVAEPVVEEEPISTTPTKPPPKRATRGKKRGSEAVDESTMLVYEAPKAKKRATRKDSSVTVESSIMEPSEAEMTDILEPAPKKGASKKGKPMRKASKSTASTTSTASIASLRATANDFPDDDEIERQLEADLERLTDDDEIMADSDSERSKAKIKERRESERSMQNSSHYAMFDPAPREVDDADMEDELDEMQRASEEKPGEEREPSPEPLRVPKKGRKAGPGKAAKQTKTKKAKEPTPPPEEPVDEEMRDPSAIEDTIQAELRDEHHDELDEEHDVSRGSTDTVVKKNAPARSSSLAKRGRGRPSQASVQSQESDEFVDVLEEFEKTEEEVKAEEPERPVAKRGRGRPSKISTASQDPVKAVEPKGEPAQPVVPPKKRARGRPSKASLEAAARVIEDSEMIEEDDNQETSEMVAKEESVAEVSETVEPPKKRGRGRPSKATAQATGQANSAVAASKPASKVAEAPAKRGRGRPPKKSLEAQKPSAAVEVPESDDLMASMVEDGQSDEPEPQLVSTHAVSSSPVRSVREPAHYPSTPGTVPSPAPSAAQAALSPSQSPQFSDAENEPPSSKPSNSNKTSRIALAPVAHSPSCSSPSKRNIMAGLQTSAPWTSIDLDGVLGTPGAKDKENSNVERLLRMGKELTSPEKKMTVEQWVYFNAGEAEKMLKHQCEAMVSRFESEGTRAMNALEGLIAE